MMNNRKAMSIGGATLALTATVAGGIGMSTGGESSHSSSTGVKAAAAIPAHVNHVNKGVSRSTTRPAIQVVRVYVVDHGKGRTISVPKGSNVKTVLQHAGIKLVGRDHVAANLSSVVKEKQVINVIRVTNKNVVKNRTVPFKTISWKTPVSCSSGVTGSRVTHQGVIGQYKDTWSQTFSNNHLVSQNRIKIDTIHHESDKIIQPCLIVHKVIHKSAPVKSTNKSDTQITPRKAISIPVKQSASKPQSVHKVTNSSTTKIVAQSKNSSKSNQSSPKKTVATSQSVSNVSGSHQDWMKAAGIDPSDYTATDYIIFHESGWNPSAINSSSGACGLVQALPCSKLGSSWNDPVTALKWFKSYAVSRYGSIQGAYAFWVANHWY